VTSHLNGTLATWLTTFLFVVCQGWIMSESLLNPGKARLCVTRPQWVYYFHLPSMGWCHLLSVRLTFWQDWRDADELLVAELAYVGARSRCESVKVSCRTISWTNFCNNQFDQSIPVWNLSGAKIMLDMLMLSQEKTKATSNC
jgi:hypothetical protein